MRNILRPCPQTTVSNLQQNMFYESEMNVMVRAYIGTCHLLVICFWCLRRERLQTSDRLRADYEPEHMMTVHWPEEIQHEVSLITYHAVCFL